MKIEDLESYARDLETAESEVTVEACFGGDGGPHVPLVFCTVGGMFGPHARTCRLCGSVYFNEKGLLAQIENEKRRVREMLQSLKHSDADVRDAQRRRILELPEAPKKG